ncbi:elmMI [Symbiodinium natans]|uniref:ElmMI protein n=1 Tax=Symbiodinium natans TaxID=878477 RepID=A0A812TQU1_9DINO|nr:elmMI [Symbiodinium natans]
MKGTATDKGPARHNYHRYYEKWLAPFQHKPGFKLAEIGAERGGSLHAWSRYFSQAAVICGIAYGHLSENVESKATSWDKVVVLRGDQSKRETMQLLLDKGPWDVIIDDGSHDPPHMVYSFFALWSAVNPGGLYVVEDLETNYWPDGKKGYENYIRGNGVMNGPDLSAVAKFKQFIDVLHRRQIGAPEMSIMEGDDKICSIEWGMNLVAFKKCSTEEAKQSPKFLRENYDKAIMRKWIEDAKATNPTMDSPYLPSASSTSFPALVGSPVTSISLLEAMKGTATDKGPARHNYHRYYEKWLAPFQHKPGFKLAEIGAERGGSLHAWSRYFSQAALICGIAYGHLSENVESKATSWDKVVVLRGDQSKRETMQLLLDKGPWDVIIDDGSHDPPHMVYSFFALWSAVNPGGLYVVEDLETNYWPDGKKGYENYIRGNGVMNGPDLSAVAKFKQFIDVLHRIMEGDDKICSIEWGMNLVAFKKCSTEEAKQSPKFLRENYDKAIMRKWIEDAKATNPTMDSPYLPSASSTSARGHEAIRP